MCLDGTGNQLKAKGNTNVVRLYETLSLDEPDQQVAYYDPGVGTFGAQGALIPLARWFSRILGLAFGYGLRENLSDAYTYLMRTYEPGDRIFLFGFSRGAYTARALAGMLNRAGLLRPGAENLVPYAIKVYARRKQNWTPNDWHQTAKFANTFSIEVDSEPSIPIHFLGIWDSVKAAGILRGEVRWPDTRQLPNVVQVRHAVSIDEKRRPYREYLVRPKASVPPRDVVEVWFAGVHSDVGGSFEDFPGLGKISLKWMLEHASRAGLRVDADVVRKLGNVTAGDALDRVHRMGWVWMFLGYRKRPVTPANAKIHASVRDRMAADPNYNPRAPKDTIVWDDTAWDQT